MDQRPRRVRPKTQRQLDDELQELKFVVWGVDGRNGMRQRLSEVEKTLRDMPQRVAAEIDKLRIDFEKRDDLRQREHRSYVRFSITIGVTVVCALISALAIVLTSTGKG
jgi:hypothetical protein